MYAKLKKTLSFLSLALLSAFIFEEIPRIILDDAHIWEIGPFIVTHFFMWYTIIFLITYALFYKRSLYYKIVFGIVFGFLVETFIFHKFSILLHPILYGLMFYLPFKGERIIYENEKISKGEVALVGALLTFVIFILFKASN